MWSLDAFCDAGLNARLDKQSSFWLPGLPWYSCDATVINAQYKEKYSLHMVSRNATFEIYAVLKHA